mmetsp:Transcript_28311/g.71844  ORF Transcript_28311/g.71844 Transcript_28311/m.71844 type:complete len:272 (-) Transcript_28311:1891-2706(-)
MNAASCLRRVDAAEAAPGGPCWAWVGCGDGLAKTPWLGSFGCPSSGWAWASSKISGGDFLYISPSRASKYCTSSASFSALAPLNASWRFIASISWSSRFQRCCSFPFSFCKVFFAPSSSKNFSNSCSRSLCSVAVTWFDLCSFSTSFGCASCRRSGGISCWRGECCTMEVEVVPARKKSFVVLGVVLAFNAGPPRGVALREEVAEDDEDPRRRPPPGGVFSPAADDRVDVDGCATGARSSRRQPWLDADGGAGAGVDVAAEAAGAGAALLC